MNREIKSLPMVALRGMTIMPEMVVHFDVSREKSIAAIQEAMAGDQKIFLVAQKSIETDDPTQEDVYEVGTVGTIKQIMKLPKHIVRVLVSGETRGILKQLQQDTPYLRAEVEVIDESDLVIQDDLNGEAMARSLKDTFLDYAARNGKMSKEAVAEILEIKSLKKLVDEIAANTPFYYVDQQEILGKVDFWERYETLAFKLVNEVQIMDIKDELQQKVKERVDKHQKEYILREQLKLIREELGDDSTLSDAEEFEKANVVVKTIRIEKNNKIKENMSFPTFKFKELVEEDWEDSTFGNYLRETRFLFVVYKFDQQDELRLKGCQFWNIPYDDLEGNVKSVWEKTHRVLCEGLQIEKKNGKNYNNFPKSSENPVCHVRPHAQNAKDTYELPDGRQYPKQCFWLNNSYILSQLDKNFIED